MGAHVLVVDDDPAELRHIEQILISQGHTVEATPSGEAALERLAKSEAQPISAVMLDLVMPDLDGMAVLERIARRSLQLPVIVQAGRADAGAAALRAGAFDFVVKPASPERVKASLANALRLSALEGEIQRARPGQSGAAGLADLVTRSPAMQRVRLLCERAARSSIPVLIEGEQGVGKERLANALHGSSARRGRSFVVLRCGEVRETEIEAVLFGDDGRSGKLKEASGGALFMDEIGALSGGAQASVAQLLWDRQAGGGRGGHMLPSDVRLIAATSRRLIDLVSEGQFHEGLFQRLNVLPVWLPPLRERRADIPELAQSLVARLAAETGKTSVAGISLAAMELLVAHDWPRNVGELARAIHRAVVLCDGGELSADDFGFLAGNSKATRPASAAPRPIGNQPGVAVQKQPRGEPSASGLSRPDRPSFARYGLATLLDERGEMRRIGALEEEVIRFAIGHYGGQMSEVARRLGIGRSTLYRKMKDYGIASGARAVS